MDGIIIKSFLILVGLLIFLIGYISWKRRENFETSSETTNLFQDSNLEYISCVAFNNTTSNKSKNKSKDAENTEDTRQHHLTTCDAYFSDGDQRCQNQRLHMKTKIQRTRIERSLMVEDNDVSK